MESAGVSEPIAVVGASMAGLRACEQLRAAGWIGPITAIGAEAHMPYNRPPLSKDALLSNADVTSEQWLRKTEFRRRASVSNVEWRLGTPVVGSDLAARKLTLGDGRTVSYSGLVIATGLRPRRLRATAAQGIRHVVRTLDDAVRLRGQLSAGARVVVIGGGFIGCEVALTARKIGCQVTVVEPQTAPMRGAIGESVGAAIRAHHERTGVTFVTEAVVADIANGGGKRSATLTLSDGRQISADVVVESIGSHPNIEWLTGNAIDISDGVLCNNDLSVVGTDNVIAVGDVARFPNPRFGNRIRRVEHWCMPTETAKYGARTLLSTLLGTPPVNALFTPLPTFWSDQGNLRLQGYGIPALADSSVVTRGSLTADAIEAGVVVEYFANTTPVGVLTINVPMAEQIPYRDRLTSATAETLHSEGALR
ncbi:NAD(P)/FAD-dependent oxidoreductase [Rhodococcus koreensis]